MTTTTSTCRLLNVSCGLSRRSPDRRQDLCGVLAASQSRRTRRRSSLLLGPQSRASPSGLQAIRRVPAVGTAAGEGRERVLKRSAVPSPCPWLRVCCLQVPGGCRPLRTWRGRYCLICTLTRFIVSAPIPTRDLRVVNVIDHQQTHRARPALKRVSASSGARHRSDR